MTVCARFIYAVGCCLLEGKGQPGITCAAAFLQTRSLSWGPKPALDQQVRVFLPKILVKERTGAEPCTGSPGGRKQTRGTFLRLLRGTGRVPGLEARACTTSPVCHCPYGAGAALCRGRARLYAVTVTMDSGQQCPISQFLITVFKRKQKRIQASDCQGVTTSL